MVAISSGWPLWMQVEKPILVAASVTHVTPTASLRWVYPYPCPSLLSLFILPLSCKPRGYGGMIVQVVGRGGKLTIAVCTDREIVYGEELTMDYCSYTHQDDEYLAAVCLCGSSICR